MNRLFWYVARSLIIWVSTVWAGLLCFDAVFASLGEISDIGRGEYGLKQVFAYTGLTLPRRAYALFPMACLIGTLLGLGNLAAKSELVAARASGVSIRRLIVWSCLAGIMMLLIALVVGEGLAPMTEAQAGYLRSQAIFNRVAVQDERGVWIRDRQRYVHIGSAIESTHLQDVQVFEFDENHRLLYASQVSDAYYNGENWTLHNVFQTQFNGDIISVAPIPEATWSLLIDPELIDVLAQGPDNMTLPELSRYIAYLKASEISSLRYRMHFWSRIIQPVTALVMIVLGAIFVLGRQQRSGIAWRLFVGILVGLGFKLLSEVVSQAGLVYGLPVIISVVGPILLAVLMTVVLVKRLTV